jgi:hypothetical protein
MGKLSTKSGWRLILMWPFGETNAAAMRTHRGGSGDVPSSAGLALKSAR